MDKYICCSCKTNFEYEYEKCRVHNTREHMTLPLYCPYCGYKNLLMDIAISVEFE